MGKFKCWIAIYQFPTSKHKVLWYHGVSKALKAKSWQCRSQDTWQCSGEQRGQMRTKGRQMQEEGIVRHGGSGQPSWTTKSCEQGLGTRVSHQGAVEVPTVTVCQALQGATPVAELSNCGSYRWSRQGPILSRVCWCCPGGSPAHSQRQQARTWGTTWDLMISFVSPGPWSLTQMLALK